MQKVEVILFKAISKPLGKVQLDEGPGGVRWVSCVKKSEVPVATWQVSIIFHTPAASGLEKGAVTYIYTGRPVFDSESWHVLCLIGELRSVWQVASPTESCSS